MLLPDLCSLHLISAWGEQLKGFYLFHSCCFLKFFFIVFWAFQIFHFKSSKCKTFVICNIFSNRVHFAFGVTACPLSSRDDRGGVIVSLYTKTVFGIMAKRKQMGKNGNPSLIWFTMNDKGRHVQNFTDRDWTAPSCEASAGFSMWFWIYSSEYDI